MTRDKGGGDEDIDGGLRKFLDIQKGGSEKIVGLGGGGPLTFVILNELSLTNAKSVYIFTLS